MLSAYSPSAGSKQHIPVVPRVGTRVPQGCPPARSPSGSAAWCLGENLTAFPAAPEVTKGRTMRRTAASDFRPGSFWVMWAASSASCPCCWAPGGTRTQTASLSRWSWLLAASLLRPVISDASKSILGRMGVAFNCPRWEPPALQLLQAQERCLSLFLHDFSPCLAAAAFLKPKQSCPSSAASLYPVLSLLLHPNRIHDDAQ